MRTISEVLDLAADYLKKQGVPRERREAEELLADVLRCRRMDLFLRFDTVLTEGQLGVAREALRRRGERVPLAYISGEIDFLGMKLIVSPAVLIPRPETEILVERVARFPLTGSCIDLCCGSGAIGLALKQRFPDLDVTLIDISPEALTIARDNAHRLGLEVRCVEGDLLTAWDRPVDYLVCNPPYVSESEYLALEPEVKQEPKIALISGASGFECYERLAPMLSSWVQRAAWFEIGTGMGERLKKFFISWGWQAEVTPDFAGHDRYLSLRR